MGKSAPDLNRIGRMHLSDEELRYLGLNRDMEREIERQCQVSSVPRIARARCDGCGAALDHTHADCNYCGTKAVT